jgi:hypothetical protein
MLAAEPFLIRELAAPKNLARDQESLVRPAHLVKNVTHDRFGAPRSVGLGIIEKIHALVVGGSHQVARDVVADLLAERDPRSE